MSENKTILEVKCPKCSKEYKIVYGRILNIKCSCGEVIPIKKPEGPKETPTTKTTVKVSEPESTETTTKTINGGSTADKEEKTLTQKLLEIDGVSTDMAEKIVKKYSTKEEIIEAINDKSFAKSIKGIGKKRQKLILKILE